MKHPPLAIRTMRLRNFKAIRDSGAIRFTPLTAIIGNNGSGKSSLIEGLETWQGIIEQGLDRAMQPWRGFEYVWNRARQGTHRSNGARTQCRSHPMAFEASGHDGGRAVRAMMEVHAGEGINETFIGRETLDLRGEPPVELERGADGIVKVLAGPVHGPYRVLPGFSVLRGPLVQELAGDWAFASEWQFVSLIPQAMGTPVPQNRVTGQVRLLKDGSNIAQYLLDIRRQDLGAFEGIVDAMRYVLPYATDVQPAITSELERTVYLQMTEKEFKLPGWMLSTGTLRVLALLALLRHPKPQPLIVVEEIENGLDPRTIHLLVREIQEAVESGRTQVILTTHSPYLLDLLPLSSILLADRVDEEPVFTRPADDKQLQRWANDFSPGQLYTMNRMRRAGSKG